jgi:hypothetical protein
MANIVERVRSFFTRPEKQYLTVNLTMKAKLVLKVPQAYFITTVIDESYYAVLNVLTRITILDIIEYANILSNKRSIVLNSLEEYYLKWVNNSISITLTIGSSASRDVTLGPL